MMKLIEGMRWLGRLIFLLMWLPFIGVFAGMAGQYGDWGRALAERFPTLLASSPSGLSLLSEVSMVLTFGMMLTAMGLLFGAPILAGIANRRIRRRGQRATATILSANPTGTRINDNPVVHFSLEVHPPAGSSFYADAQMLVSQVDIMRYQPGMEVPVRYDPQSFAVAISEER